MKLTAIPLTLLTLMSMTQQREKALRLVLASLATLYATLPDGNLQTRITMYNFDGCEKLH